MFSHDNGSMLDEHKEALAQQYCQWLHYKYDRLMGESWTCHLVPADNVPGWPFEKCENCKAR